MPAKQALERALAITGGDRAESYGSMWENHENIARLWNGYLWDKKGVLVAEDVANMMELLKIARRKLGVFNPDDYKDGAGYASVALECREFEWENSPRLSRIDNMTKAEMTVKKMVEEAVAKKT